MAQLEACLVDAYDTIVTCDFSVQQAEIAAMAGLPVQTWHAEYERIEPWLTDGRITKTQAFGDILRTCGQQPRAALVAAMVARDRELLLANAHLYDDAIGFLEALRACGIRIAIVSNCTETTRPLLVKLGRRVRGRPGPLLRGRRGRGHHRGADRAGRARWQGARRRHHGGPVAARGAGDVRGVAGRRNSRPLGSHAPRPFGIHGRSEPHVTA